MRSRTRGFTLLELMIVVVIVAILTAVAYPSYTNYVLRTRRAEAKDLAVKIASAEERYFTRFNRYGDAGELAGAVSFDSLYYTAEIVLGDAAGNEGQTYVLSLTPKDDTPQVHDQCGVLTINNTGGKDWDGDESNGKCW